MVERFTENTPREPKRRGGRWSLALLAALLAAVAALFVLSVRWRATLRVQNVTVEGTEAVSPKEIVALAKITPQSPLYGVNLEEALERIEHHPFIRSAGLYRQLPNTVVVDVAERTPVAVINCGQLCYVDEEGVLLPCGWSDKKFDLPLISGVEGMQSARPGKAVMNKELAEAIGICRTAHELDTTAYRLISEVNMNNGGDVILYAAEAGVPVVLGHGGLQKKLVLLEQFWTTNIGNAGAENVQYIDLRFEDQIVVKWQQPPGQGSKKATS